MNRFIAEYSIFPTSDDNMQKAGLYRHDTILWLLVIGLFYAAVAIVRWHQRRRR